MTNINISEILQSTKWIRRPWWFVNALVVLNMFLEATWTKVLVSYSLYPNEELLSSPNWYHWFCNKLQRHPVSSKDVFCFPPCLPQGSLTDYRVHLCLQQGKACSQSHGNQYTSTGGIFIYWYFKKQTHIVGFVAYEWHHLDNCQTMPEVSITKI